MASNKANLDWWTETPKDLILHDQIWYNAIRALVSVESRSDSRIADAALDRLIREDLIDRDEKEVSLAMQQWLRYLAILADRLANSQGVLSKEVIGYLNLFVLLLTNWQFSSFRSTCQKEMEACLKHLQGFNKSLCDLADSNKDGHRRIDKRAKEVEGLKKRVVELESRNILLEAKVRDSAMVN